ncbi:hypothetical protein C2S52_016062 [Perilla frutescens var. hirtella]|nr:hypothetical protein C2S52_016062 [Perilla frutescens var. hirtella]
MFPTMLRWCVPKSMITVYDEWPPQTSTDEKPILVDLGMLEYEESIELLRDVVDDYYLSDAGLDNSDDEFNVQGETADEAADHTAGQIETINQILARLCANSDEMLLVMRDLSINVTKMADNVASMQSDLHELVKVKQGVEGADMVGCGVGCLDVDEGVNIVGELYVPPRAERKESVSQPGADAVKNAGE